MLFIVQSGLIRRLVEADDVEAAQQEFLGARLMWQHLSDVEGSIEIWPATDAEIADFRKRRRPKFEEHPQLELDDVRAGYGNEERS